MRTTFLAAISVLFLSSGATPPVETTTGAARSSVYLGKSNSTKQLASTTDDAGTGEVTLKVVPVDSTGAASTNAPRTDAGLSEAVEVDTTGVALGTATNPKRVDPTGTTKQPIAYPAMARTSSACVSATWTVDGDGGLQGQLLAADGGVPVSGVLYICTATGDGCFTSAGQPHNCSFAAGFFEKQFTAESFPTPNVYGLGIGGSTTFVCCPYAAQ